MGLNNMVVLKLGLLLLFLVGVTTARLEYLSYSSIGLNGGHDSRRSDPSESSSKSKACCDHCACTKSQPPQCHCADIRLDSCHSACETCLCTFSIPAQCRCADTTDFCYKPCSSSEEEDHLERNE